MLDPFMGRTRELNSDVNAGFVRIAEIRRLSWPVFVGIDGSINIAH